MARNQRTGAGIYREGNSMTPRELREAQTHALIVDMMENPRPEDLPKIYAGLEHFFAKNWTASDIENECRYRSKV
jgi:hypothetical protein